MQGPSRTLWILAILVSVMSVAGLSYGLYTDWDTKPDRTAIGPRSGNGNGSGFGLGLMIGVGAGITAGSLIAWRKRQ